MQAFPAFVRILSVGLLAGLSAPALHAQKEFSDPTIGIKIKPPAKWTYLGTLGDRGALRVLYAGPRSYASKSQRGLQHTPTMRVLWFPKGEGKEQKESKWPKRTPYTDHEDYLKRVYPGLKRVGYDVGSVGKFDGRRYVMAQEGGLSLHLAAVKLDDGDLAIEYECLTEQHKKLAGGFDKSLATLTKLPKKPAAKAEAPMWVTDHEGWMQKPAAERKKIRTAWGKAFLADRKKQSEPGWKQHKAKDYLVLSHADAKFTKRVVKALDVIRPWVEKQIGTTSDDIVMPAVVRIFADANERRTYRLRDVNPLDYEPQVREIWFYKDASVGNTGAGFGPLFRGVFDHVLHDKHPLVKDNLPRWLDNGLTWYMDSSKLKGKKLTFPSGKAETGRFQYHKQNNSLEPLWGFIQEKSQPSPKGGENEKPWGFTPECVRVVRWFIEGDGDKYFDKPSFLGAYLAQIGKTAAKFDPDPGASVDQRFLKDSQAKELNEMIYSRRDKFLEKVNYEVIPLSGENWKKADAAFRAFAAEVKG